HVYGAWAASVWYKRKVTALRYFTDDKRDDGDKTYARLGFKGETQINDQMIGFGHWEYDFKGYNDEANGSRGKNL
ncbi:hypothetical protein DI386_24835, partial [Escherichia coli]